MKTKISTILALVSLLMAPYQVISQEIDNTVETQLYSDVQLESGASETQSEEAQKVRTVVQEAEAKIQPVAKDVKFLLKSKMNGNRQLFWNEDYGQGQYRLRIQDSNPNNKRAWWIFDARTKTMRSDIKRNLVVSNQLGKGFQIGQVAVVRPWKGEAQQVINFYSGCKRNVRNAKNSCLDVSGGKNANNQPVTFWTCHDGDNQAWAISQLKVIQIKEVDEETKGKFPIKDGEKFIIRSEMKNHRMLYANEPLDANQRIVRIRDFDAHVLTAYWVFDSRTNTIRSAHYRGHVLSNRNGYGFQIGQHAVIRKFNSGDKTQIVKFQGGNRQNIKNNGGKCLDVAGGADVHNQHVIWWNCHNGANQGWKINTISSKPAYKQPLKDGVEFYIRSKMSGNRLLFWHENIGQNQFRLRIHNWDLKNIRQNADLRKKSQWVFDSRTRTIRVASDRKMTLSNQAGQGFNIGHAAVVREWRREVHQKIRVFGGNTRNIRNDGGKCLDVHGAHNSHMRHVIWWNCHNGANQGWNVVKAGDFELVVTYQEPSLKDGAKFQFRNSMSGGKAIFVDSVSMGNGQFRLKMQNHAPWENRQWFTFDRRTKSIRQFFKRNMAISRTFGTKNLFSPGPAVARPWRNENVQKSFHNKERHIQDFGNFVITPDGFANSHMNTLTWWTVSKKHPAQIWKIDTKGINFPPYPLKDGERFQIKTRLASHRAISYHEDIGGKQFRLRIQNNEPWKNNQWFVFDSRTHTIRAWSDRNLVMSNQQGQNFILDRAMVMRQYKNEHNQVMLWYKGSKQNIRTMNNKCLDVHGGSDSQHRHLILWNCHNGNNQAWYIDRKATEYPEYPIKDGVKFQIKSKMPGHKALFWSEHIGGEQYRLRIRFNSPENNKQWWIFDSRTKTIRPFAKKNFVLANQKGQEFRLNVAVVIRKYEGHYTEKTKWINGNLRNIQNINGNCLDVAGGSNSQNQHVIFWNCHNGLNQAWIIDQTAINWPQQPLDDGVKFQIRSKMQGGKALFWHDQLGGNEYMLRIQNHAPYNEKQWWFFDKRSRTIRPVLKKDFALSHRKNQGFSPNVPVVIRKFEGETNQKSAFWSTKAGNIRDISGFCLDVHGGHNSHHRHVIWWDCHKGANQQWTLDTKGINFPAYPLSNGIRFQIKSSLESNRALYLANSAAYGDYYLRIQDNNPYDVKQWWVFDWRTRTIRSSSDRKLVIQNQKVHSWTTNAYTTVGKYEGRANQQIRWFSGKNNNLRDIGERCIQALGNSHQAYTHWYKCSSNAGQSWIIDTKGYEYPKQPLGDGVKFQIRTRMQGGKALFWAEKADRNQIRLRIHWNDPYDNRQWFVFDSRTQTIRAWAKKNYCIGNHLTQNFNVNQFVGIRPYTGSNQDRIRWYSTPKQNIQNNGKKCLDVAGGRNDDNQHVIFWNCHNGDNQAWWIDQRSKTWPKQPLQDGVKFQLRSRMQTGRAIFFSEDIGGKQYRLRIQPHKPFDNRQWFVFDSRTKSIRAHTKRNYAISNQRGQRFLRNKAAVIREWIGESMQMAAYYSGDKRNIRNVPGQCLDVHGGHNHDNRHLIWWDCHNGDNQAWIIDRQGVEYPKYPLQDGVRFQIKTVLKSRRALTIAEHIGSNQYRLRIQNNDPYDLKQWWVFDWRTKTIRSASNRNRAISIQIGGTNWAANGYNAVSRDYQGEVIQRIRWFDGTRRNIRDVANRCLDVYGGADNHWQHIIWWTCHNGANQGWSYDLTGNNYPKQPLAPGVKFQIKSKRSGNRAVYWHSSDVGQGQHRLKIQDNDPTDDNQWFVFDNRTNTIRAHTKRDFSVGNQLNVQFGNNQMVTLRKYKGRNNDRIKWFEGPSRNIRNNGGYCMQLQSNQNVHDTPLLFSNCQQSTSQAWYLDQQGLVFKKNPIADGVKFQIRSKLPGGRALFYHEALDNNRYRIRIQNHEPFNPRQWWFFDSRTRTIRSNDKKNFVISTQLGGSMRHNFFAVLQRWGINKKNAYQQATFFSGKSSNIRNPGGRCLGVDGNRNTQHMTVKWYDCTSHAGHGWTLDQKGVSYPAYPLKDGVKFQIKTQMNSKRALIYSENIGGQQFRLRIQDNNPYDIKQWWVFDSRTHSIRSASNRKLAVSLQHGSVNWSQNNYAAVAREFKGENLQQIRWYSGSRRNIRDLGTRCLDVHGNADQNKRHVHWYGCHNGLNQAWSYDLKGFNYPAYPLADGVKFQIRSKMEGNKALFWSEHIGGEKYRLRIQAHDPENEKQWWFFDSRTHTVRPLLKKDFVLANDKGHGFSIGVAATIRQYNGDITEKTKWFNGAHQNIRNHGGKCLDVAGGSNSHNQHVIFWNCHNGQNQAWYIDQSGPAYHKQPLGDGVKFQIRTNMASSRALYMAEHIGGNQFIMRIRTHAPYNADQWFVFDKRTKSIRSHKKRNFALSNLHGKGFSVNQYAVMREWIDESYQKISFYPGPKRNLRNPSGKCLDVHGNSDSENRHVIFWHCHDNENQKWRIDREGVQFPKYPLKDGVKFQIKTQMDSKRAIVYHEDIGGKQYRLRIQNNDPYDVKQWWVFDNRTHTIRSASNRNLVISVQVGGTNPTYYSYAAVARKFISGDVLNQMRWYGGKNKNIRDVMERCADVNGASDSHHNHIIFHKCHNGKNQGWNIDTEGHNYPKFPLADGAKFQIKSRMAYNRALYMAEDIGGSQYRLRIRDNFPGDKLQWFTFDSRTNSIRAWNNRNLALANQRGQGFNINVAVVMRQFKGDNTDRVRWNSGKTQNIQNNGKKCLDVHGASNTNNRHVIFWNCHNGLNQGWILDQKGEVFTNQPLDDGVKFMIKSGMANGRAVTITEHIGGNQFRLRIKTFFKADTNQWFVFDKRTRTVRAAYKRNFAISNQKDQKMTLDRAVVIRAFVPDDSTQKLFFFKGPNRNFRNAGGHCLAVHGGHDHENRHLIFNNCHNKDNQVWSLSTSSIEFPKYPLRDGIAFQIRSKMTGGKALFWSEAMGRNQYRLRIRETNPGDNKQWFVFDQRTKSIRTMANRKLAISIDIGGTNWFYNGYNGLVRPYNSENLQQIRWFSGQFQNIRDIGQRCLDVAGARNSQNSHTIWYKCHNGANQAWVIDTKGIQYPKQPLASGVKFQIRSKMTENRALFNAEHIGGNQYRLRIQDHNPDDKRQWFTFDSRTQTIRSYYKRGYALANQAGQGFNVNVAAVIRPYTGHNTEKSQWHSGSKRNIRNNGGKCLDVHGGSNTHNRHVIFWHCHDGLNQAWMIDQTQNSYTKAPLADGVKFQLRSKMANGKAVSWHEHIGGNQYRLRLQNHASFSDNQWFVFDQRTQSIRAFSKRNYAISNQDGYQHRPRYAAVIRPWKDEPYQKIFFVQGKNKNIRNNARICLDAPNNNNKIHLQFHPCNNGLQQSWFIDRTGVEFPKYPIQDGKRFQIRSLMNGGRALFVSEHIGSNQYRLRIRNNEPEDIKQWFVFDWRTKSIRSQADRRNVISIQIGGNNWYHNGYAAVVRRYDQQNLQKIRWFNGEKQNIRDMGVRCLDVAGGSNSHNNHVHWWTCHNGANQGWKIDTEGIKYPVYPIKDGVAFQIRTKYFEGKRPIKWSSGNWVTLVDNDPYDQKQWFVFDSRTHSIRAKSNRNYALSVRKGHGFNNNVYAQVRPWENESNQHVQWHEGSLQNIRHNRGGCLDIQNGRNVPKTYIIWYNCHNGHNQAWFLDQSGAQFNKQPIEDGEKFQIISHLASKRALYVHYQHIGSNQYRLKIRDSMPGEDSQWFVFDKRTHSVRSFSRRNYAISNLVGHGFKTIGSAAVIRPWKNEPYQKLSYYPGQKRNFRTPGGQCLDVYQVKDVNDQNVIFWTCHNQANQGWSINRVGLTYPRYPLKDGIKFQIKSRFSGNRALFWHEHIGNQQYRLRIQNNDPLNNRQWWVFDWRTKTIRAYADRNKVISVQLGVQSVFQNNYIAVVRNYKGDSYQKMRMFPGTVRNIRNAVRKCLHAAGNSHYNIVQWNQCNDGQNQGWYIDRVAVKYPVYPLASGVKFQIKSRMAENRALHYGEQNQKDQYILRIQDNNPEDNSQWWTFDDRTKTIRSWTKRSHAISNQQGQGFKIGVYAVIRPWKNQHEQNIKWYGGSRQNIKNLRDKCLDVHGGSNTHNRWTIFYNCHNGLNQAWYIDQKDVSYPKQPLNDGVKFQIRSRMTGGRALFWSEHIGANQFRLRIRDHLPGEGKQWFVFDKRTRTIRSAEKRGFAISNQLGQGYRIGVAVVIRPWIGEIYQKIAFYGGNIRNIRNNGGKCLDVAGASNTHNRHVIFWTCHNGANQGWVLDTQGVKYPKQALKDGVRFQIKTRMQSHRALVVTEDIGGKQFRLRIQDSNSWDLKQWFVFDSRTRTIRTMSDRRNVISGQNGKGFTNGNNAVVRVYQNHSNQKMSFWPGKLRNIRNNARQCLDVHGGADQNMRYTIFYGCHNGLNQAWIIDTKATEFPQYPLGDGIKFQIKSRMAGHRALFMAEDIGGNQLRLRIQDNNPDDVRQWFVFDSRTRTIRSHSKRNLVLANQKGQEYRIDVAATMRPFSGEVYEMSKWISGKYRTIQNLGGKCLDVHGASNTNNRHVIFYNCHNGLNQAWDVDQTGWVYPKQPLNDGVKFQIKSMMKENRALFYSEHIGGNQYRLRIRDNNPEDDKQWFVFDRRTHTIRASAQRNLALSNQQGQQYRVDVAAVMRPWRKEPFQRISYYSGTRRNIRNNGQKCLDVHGGSNTDNRHVIFWHCHNGLNQAWYLDRTLIKYNKYPENDGTLFQIKTGMKSRRALFMSEHIGGNQFRLRIRDNKPKDNKQWFVFDQRTHTIRAASDRKLTLSNQAGKRFAINVPVVMRPYKNSFYQRIHWVAGSRRNIQNNGRKCLDVHGGSDSNNRHVIFWNCHDGLNQAWSVDKTIPKTQFPPYPLGDGIKFQIKSRMSGNRALYWKDLIGKDQYRVRIQDNNPPDNRQWWIFDSRTHTVRAFSKRNFALSGRNGKNFDNGVDVVIRAYKGQPTQQIVWLNKSRQNVRFNNKKCLDVHGNVNTHDRHTIFYSCHNGLNQAWFVDQTGYTYPKQPIADGIRFQIKSRMANFRPLFWDENIGGQQFRLRIRDDQWKNNRQWFVFDKRTRTIRAFSDKNLAISNQQGQAFRIGKHAVVRPYKNEVYQRIAYYGGSVRNLRNNGQKCLDVAGGINRHRQHVIFWNCHNGVNQGWFLTSKHPAPPKPLPPVVKPTMPIPSTPTKYNPIKPPKGKKPTKTKPSKPIDPSFGPKPIVTPTKIEKEIRNTFTYDDMVTFYRRVVKGTGIRWTGKYFPGTRPTFEYMVDYFIKVIGRRPSATRYQWLYQIVQCLIKQEPVNNRLLRNWVQKAIQGQKSKNYKVPDCVKHMWSGRLGQKPTYNDLASIVRFAFYNRRITYRGLYLFIWTVINEDKPVAQTGHTDFWKQYAGVRSQYVSGLEPNKKFLLLTGTKKIVLGDTIKPFTKLSNSNYFFFDSNTKSIRWLGSHTQHLGVVGGLKAGSRVRLVSSKPGKEVRRQDMFIYDIVDMKFHSYVNKDLCITFKNPTKDGDRMVLGKCSCKYGNPATQEILVKYFKFDDNNGFKPYRVFTLRSVANKNLALKISNDGSLLLPSQRYAKIATATGKNDDEFFFWDPKQKCLKNYLYDKGCIGSVQQGCSVQMISLGKSGNAGSNCNDIKYDGTFLWINGKVASPQAGYVKNNIHVSLNDLTGDVNQRWQLQNTNIKANEKKSTQQMAQTDSNWGWDSKGLFQIKAFNGKVLSIAETGKISLKKKQNTADEMFYFDTNTKTITSRKFKGISLASQEIGANKFKLVARKTQRTTPELFTKPSTGGIIQLAANKNFVWRADDNEVNIVQGDGDMNWKQARTYFQIVPVGRS